MDLGWESQLNTVLRFSSAKVQLILQICKSKVISNTNLNGIQGR
jgi:hypothetical protein